MSLVRELQEQKHSDRLYTALSILIPCIVNLELFF